MQHTDTADLYCNHRTLHFNRRSDGDDDRDTIGDANAHAHTDANAILNAYVNIDDAANGDTNADEYACADENVYADAYTRAALSRHQLARATRQSKARIGSRHLSMGPHRVESRRRSLSSLCAARDKLKLRQDI